MASTSNENRKGRKKVKMEKMEKESNLRVTFSKRRKGAIRKAQELTILTGAEVALIIFSPGGKVYSFGHPTVEAVIDKFVTGISQPLTPTQLSVQNERDKNVSHINRNLDDTKNMLAIEKKRGEELDKLLVESLSQYWGVGDMEEQRLPQLQQSIVALKNFEAALEGEIHARTLLGQQNYSALEGRYNYNGGEAGLLQSVGVTYNGNGSGSGSGLPALSGPIAYASGQDSDNRFLQFPMGRGGYGVGGSSSVAPNPTSMGLYGSGGGGGWSLGVRPSTFSGVGGGGSSIVWPNSFVVGGGGGRPFNAGVSSLGGGRGDGPFIAGPSSFVGCGGPFIAGTNPFIGCGGLSNAGGANPSGGYGVGGSGRVTPNPAGMGVFGNGGGWLFSAGPSTFSGGGGPFIVGPNYFVSDGGGTGLSSNAEPSSHAGGGPFMSS